MMLLCVVLTTQSALAEFTCLSDVSYKWKREKDEKESEVKVITVEHGGIDESTARAQLTRHVDSERLRAQEQCSDAHENLTKCIASKYASVNQVHSNLGFSARKALEDAVKNDCQKSQGICLGTSASEAVCKEKVVAVKEAAAETPADPKAAGKEEKKGKKK